MAAKFEEGLPNGETKGTKYQILMGRLFPACADVNECSECLGEEEGDLCWWVFRVMDRQTPVWWEKEIAKAKLKEGVKPRTLAKSFPEVSLIVQCPNCHIQEPITLLNWELEGSVKFAQTKQGEVLHKCLEGVCCEVRLLNGMKVADYIREMNDGQN